MKSSRYAQHKCKVLFLYPVIAPQPLKPAQMALPSDHRMVRYV
ncbi:Hypothetical protein ETEE_3703 [Edwardsiella anguillarum ET080813]|uniref:Uncharacterized protein n=1 Tax=Edwardsiella anguillarum ET080813 TaxID=667120 RepID=A0A076LNH5_9GAMM|nr:Hypothetical protein ETEE_3703 [Edwardsiella anguillarum ET080813]